MTLTKPHDLSPEQQRRRLELVIEGTRLGMWDWNPQTGEVTFNDIWAEMLGHTLDEIEPSLKEWEDRVHPDDLSECYANIQAHMEGKTPFYENVHRMKHRDGHWVYILDRGKVVEWDDAGRPVRFTGTHTDITAQKRAELAAVRASRAKSLFLANMSHEIRTPLHGVLGLVQLLDQSHLDEQQRSYVDIIRECGEGLLTVINDILDYSKIDAGRMTIDPHVCNLPQGLRLAHDLYREQAQERGLAYELIIEEGVPAWIICDSHRLKQVLLNLLSNAVKFTRKGAVTTRVWAQPVQDGEFELTIAVRDTGPGIADPSSIWDNFDQEEDSTARNYGGTGLGLSISRSLVEQMGGAIDLVSGPHEGSEFTIRVPVKVSSPPDSQAEGAEDEERPLPPLEVLVAEDNPVNQLIVRRMLESLGMTVTLASTGTEAVDHARSRPFDVIFMDVHMPDMNGLDATRAIRRFSGDSEPPIIALSADALKHQIDVCLEAGMTGHLIKPFQLRSLVQVLRQIADAAEAPHGRVIPTGSVDSR